MLPSLLYLPMVSNDLPSVLVSYVYAWSPMFMPGLLGLPMVSYAYLCGCLPVVSYVYTMPPRPTWTPKSPTPT